MSKKNKNKAPNFTNMTEEEKEIYEESQRIAEKIAKHKQEHILNKYLNRKLQKEDKMSNLNNLKLNNHWRKVMRESKSREIVGAIEILSCSFEQVIDRKTNVLKCLAKELSDADEQYLIAVRFHMINMDTLINHHQERIAKLKVEYQFQVESVTEEFDTERQFMIDQHREELKDLKDIIVAFDMHYANKENEALLEYSNICDEMKNKNIELKHVLRSSLEIKVNELWSQMTAANANYANTTNERRQNLEHLLGKDEASASDIKRQMRKFRRLAEQIAVLKSKTGNVSKEYDDKDIIMREEKDRLVCKFQQMKGQMNKLREVEREKLTNMSLQSNDAVQSLKRLTDKAERILKFAEMCRKYETEEEKVLPFYSSGLDQYEVSKVNDIMSESPDEPCVDTFKTYRKLELFRRRFNKVKLDRLCAEKERNVLAVENSQLRNLLKQYLDGISVNAEIISELNPLIAINGRTNFNMSSNIMDPRVRAVPTVILEAAQIVHYEVTTKTLSK